MNMEICVVTTNLSPSRPLSGSLLSFRVSQKEFYQMLQNVSTHIASIIRVEQIFIKLIDYHSITSEEMHLIYIRKFQRGKQRSCSLTFVNFSYLSEEDSEKKHWNSKFYLKHLPTEGTFTTDQDPCKFSEASGGHITSSNGKCAPIPNCYVALQII